MSIRLSGIKPFYSHTLSTLFASTNCPAVVQVRIRLILYAIRSDSCFLLILYGCRAIFPNNFSRKSFGLRENIVRNSAFYLKQETSPCRLCTFSEDYLQCLNVRLSTLLCSWNILTQLFHFLSLDILVTNSFVLVSVADLTSWQRVCLMQNPRVISIHKAHQDR